MPRYIFVGCAGIDHIILAGGEQLPPQPGGSAVYAAVGARMWSPDVGIAALINKTYPQEWIDELSVNGIDTRGVFRSGQSLGLEGTIRYLPDGSRQLGAASGMLGLIERFMPWLLVILGRKLWPTVCPEPQHIPEDFLPADFAMITAMAHTRQAQSLRHLSRSAGTIILDPAPLMPGVKRGTMPAELHDLSAGRFVLPSEQELIEYFGKEDVDSGAQQFFNHGARGLIVKLGEQGALVYASPDQPAQATPVYPVKQVVDTTGAGDSFGGGFLVGLSETRDPVRAALYGAVSASFVIEGFGALHALGITRAQAEERLNTLSELFSTAL